MKRVVVFSTSLREGSNSEILAGKFCQGAEDAGHRVEVVSLKDKNIAFCKGCNACETTGRCATEDDANEMAEKIKDADVAVFATPLYHSNISGAMKTLLDRLTPAMAAEYNMREVYMIVTAADDSEDASADAEQTLKGWIGSFKKSKLSGVVRGLGVDGPKEAEEKQRVLQEAYEMGKSI